jgi:hypothetical protein
VPGVFPAFLSPLVTSAFTKKTEHGADMGAKRLLVFSEVMPLGRRVTSETQFPHVQMGKENTNHAGLWRRLT